jgi:hypothetical protein
MTFYTKALSKQHQDMLYRESAIEPSVAQARGYRTIRHRSEVPEEFAKWQRRLGLLVPTHSPDGETSGHQLRPDKPILRKNGNAPRYETPHGSRITLDVNPLMLDKIRHGDGDLWITEGPKKVDALTGRSEPTVGIIGVWNFAEPGSKSRVPLACWNHVRLRGRRVIIVYDADARTNPDVQEALRRLVAMLEELGATVLVVYLPVVNDNGKSGVDDYLAAGGTVAELRLMAAPYQPVDVGAERMNRDEKLHARIADLEHRWVAEEWKGMGGHTDRDVYLKLIEAAKRHGKIHPEGVRVMKAQGPLALEAKISSRTLWKSLNRLEDKGLCYRDNEGREAEKAGAFVLRADVSHKGRKSGQEGGTASEERGYGHGDLHLRAPRLRWSVSKWKPGPETRRKYRLGEISWLPEPRDHIKRLGKIRGAILDALDAGGGTLTLQQLAETLHRARPRDIRRRNLPMLEDAGMIQVNGDTVSLTDNWLEALEEQRRLGKELEAEELARTRYKVKSRSYHGRHDVPKSQPSAAGLDAIKRSHAQRQAGLAAIAERAAAAAKSEEQRRAEAFVRDRLRELGRIRLALLQDIWHDAGGDPWTIPRAVEAMGCCVEELPEFGNRRFVFPPAEGAA